jgi:hypothetical protein
MNEQGLCFCGHARDDHTSTGLYTGAADGRCLRCACREYVDRQQARDQEEPV